MHKFLISNIDTDSFTCYKKDQSKFSREECQFLLKELNSICENGVSWEDDGYYSCVIIVKAKNYVMQTEDGKIKYKGSALIDTKREPKFRQFIKDFIQLLLEDRKAELLNLYNNYAKQIMNITDIKDYVQKKTITNKVLNPQRTNEEKVLEAVANEELIQEGDKIFVYFREDGSLALDKNWKNDHDKWKLLKRLYDTVKIFDKIVSKSQFPNYSLKGKRKLLENLD